MIIDPFVWVWALEGKGYVLLQYPYDFVYLSLTTLSIGVAHITVNVSLAGNNCFQEASDSERETMLAYLFIDAALEANDTLTVNETDFTSVKNLGFVRKCLKTHQMLEMLGYMHTIHLYYCHSSYTNGSRFVDVTPKHKWPLLIEICMTIASLFSPLLLTLISQQNPPKVQKGKRYLAINSDLPVGVHYCLFHSYRKRKCVLIIRTFIGISIFLSLGTPLYVVPLSAYKTSYFLHNNTSDWPQYTLFHLGLIIGTFVFYLIFAALYWICPDRFASASKRTLKAMEIHSLKFVKYCNLKADSRLKFLQIIKTLI